ncbi:tyrosinase [Ceratobasidium sp. AG-Ba]|nr:tyrosinase [Ceratobasidium sp. AG-Ba]
MKFFAAAILALTGFVSAMPAEKRAGNCTSPAVHMEWRSLSQAQRNSFHNAVKCLQTKPSNVNGVSSFNRYPSVHSDVFGSVHYVAQFLPWHRWFLHLRRLDLQDCGYTGPVPYWDWTIDSGKLATSNIWDPTTGFGGNGNTRTSAHCVENGPYANFQSPLFGSPLQQRERPKRFLNNNNYNDFSNDVEEIPHDAIHNVISGDMAAAFSPNDALNIDRIWAKWQGRGSRLQEYTGNTVQGQSQTNGSRFPLAKLSDMMPMKGIRGLPDIRVADVMDTMSDSLCYVYDK